jgi:hypothetical protein
MRQEDVIQVYTGLYSIHSFMMSSMHTFIQLNRRKENTNIRTERLRIMIRYSWVGKKNEWGEKGLNEDHMWCTRATLKPSLYTARQVCVLIPDDRFVALVVLA